MAKPRSSSDGLRARSTAGQIGDDAVHPAAAKLRRAARHDAGSTTLKLIGLAVLAVSIGAIDPFTRQCAGTPPVSFQDGADSVTLRTGSPIADGGNVAPSRSAVHSAAVIAFPTAVAGFAAGAGLA